MKQLFILACVVLWSIPNFTFGQCNFTVDAGSDTVLCNSGSVQLTTNINGLLPGVPSYQWTPTTGLNNPNSANPIATVNSTTSYVVEVSIQGSTNLITNGDFENGATGFTTSYNAGSGGTWGPTSWTNTYMVTTNPSLAHSSFAACDDHTPNPGDKMMVVNGSTVANTSIWCQTINVNPNSTYSFSMWSASAITGSPAVIQAHFNGVPNSNSLNLSFIPCNWRNYTATWNSGSNTSLTLCLYNTNLSSSGNDFAIDDISLIEQCSRTDTVTVIRPVIPPTVIYTTMCQGDTTFTNNGYLTTVGSYFDTLSAVSGCDSIIEIVVGIQQPVRPNLGIDTTLCGNDPFLLSSKTGNVTYEWDDGSTDSTRTVNSSGSYFVQVTDSDGCTNSDTINVNYDPYPIVDFGNDTSFCFGDQRVLRATQDQAATFLWQDGSTGSTFVVSDPGGAYSVDVTIGNCTINEAIIIDYQACNCTVGLPNAFTPNGDNKNDIFQALFQNGCSLASFSLKIFNRWGDLVYQTTNTNEGWDGRIGGKLQAQDSYLYLVEYELDSRFNATPMTETGTFLLVR